MHGMSLWLHRQRLRRAGVVKNWGEHFEQDQ
jgi:hypothetical protein